MPVISQVSSTQNCESTFPLGSLSGLAEKDGDEEEVTDPAKAMTLEETSRDDNPKTEVASIAVE